MVGVFLFSFIFFAFFSFGVVFLKWKYSYQNVYFGKMISKQGNKPEMTICDTFPTSFCISVTVRYTTKLLCTTVSKIKSILLVDM